MLGKRRLMKYTPIEGTHRPITVFDEEGSIIGALRDVGPWPDGDMFVKQRIEDDGCECSMDEHYGFCWELVKVERI